MNVNDDSLDDCKPSATNTPSDIADASKSSAERNAMLSTGLLTGRNTREFAHALNHVSTEDLPTYTRDHNSLLTFPEKVPYIKLDRSTFLLRSIVHSRSLLPFL